MEKKKVLIVEDEAAIARLMAIIVKDAGAEAETASNGAEGLQKVVKYQPDLLIVDLIMPIMSGEELIQQVQGDPDLAHIPIVLLTTRQSAAGYKRREFPLISKPFEPNAVKEMIRNMLGIDT